MSKNKLWKYLTIFAATLPNVGAIIDAIGLDVLIMLVASHVIIFGSFIYHQYIKSILVWLNMKFERLDPLYFIPKIAQIKECPQLIFHSIPFMVAISFLLFAQVTMFS